jgi:hypothetical protein
MRRPQFKLKWLLLAVAFCALASATVWQFWPRYRAYRARMQFEAAAAGFSPGMSVDAISATVGHGGWNGYSSDAQGTMVGLTPYFFEGAWYCIYMKLDKDAGTQFCGEMPSTSIEVFRLAVPPKGYLPQTQAAKDEVFPTASMKTYKSTPTGTIEVQAPRKYGEDARRAAYIQDFYEHITQRTTADLGIAYERLVAKQK